MSYASHIEGLVASQLVYYQAELMLAKMSEHRVRPVRMPNGYPEGVYRPPHPCSTPRAEAFIAHTGGRLSNGVPRVLGMEVVHGYTLGAYNPANDCTATKRAA